MGCSSCGKSTAAPLNNVRVSKLQKSIKVPEGPCDYTNEILNVWADKLKWFKNKGLYVNYKVRAGTLNKFIGIVLTSINVNNKCNYKKELDNEIKTLVTFITGIYA